MILDDRAGGVSREHPWPGLMPFTEEARAFFHGRDEEAAELLRLIKRESLTVLFGLSGLGKSSLLNAGLFPRLREEDFLPIYVRLDVLGGKRLAAEALRILAESARAAGVDAPEPRAGDTLWEYFHRREADFWSARNRLLTPVLVFDQFEELFTIGRHGADTQRRCADFLEELADLVEDRTPAKVLAAMEADAGAGEELDFARHTFKVVLAFREDYLPEFEALRGAMPSIMRGRLRLTRMNGVQAREAILQPGGHLVSASVGEHIIRFVASPRRESAADIELERLEIEPALLSVVCRELNNKRIGLGRAQVSADLLEEGAQHEIIREFYEEALAGIDPRVREFVEDQLLTEAGYRDSYALEDALRLPGVAREAIDTLIARRLVRLDERSGVLRVELTHDLLTRVAKASRDLRKQTEAARRTREVEAARRRRTRVLAGAGAAIVVAAVGLAAVFAVLLERSNQEKRRLIETQSNVMLEQAIGQLERGVATEPQAILAEALRLNPGNAAAVARMVTYLSRRPFARELGARTLGASEQGVDARAGVSFMVSDKLELAILDLESGKPVGAARTLAAKPQAIAIAADRSRLAWDEGPGRVVVGTPDSAARTELALPRGEGSELRDLTLAPDGRLLIVRTVAATRLYVLDGPEPVVETLPAVIAPAADTATTIALGRGGGWVAFGGRRSVVAWNRLDGRTRALDHPSPVNALEFSADGRFLVTAAQDKNARVWDLQDSRLVGPPLVHEGSVIAAAFGPAGDKVITGSLDRTARIWSSATGAQLTEPIAGNAPIVQARLAAEGLRATTLDGAQRFARWEVVAPPAAVAINAARQGVSAVDISTDGRRVASLVGAQIQASEARSGAAGRELRPLWSRRLEAADAVSLRWSADARALAVGTASGAVVLLAGDTGATVATLAQPVPARAFEFNADGDLLAIAGDDEAVRVWHLETRAMLGLPLEHRGLAQMRWDPSGRMLVTAEGEGRVRLWDARSTLPVASIDPTLPRARVAYAGFTARAGELVVVEEKVARLFLVEHDRRGFVVEQRARLPFLNTIWSADVSPRQGRLAVGAVDGSARLIELETLRLVGSAMKHDGVVVALGFSADGQWLVSRTEQTTRVWDARTGYPVADTVRHESRTAQAALMGGGAWLVTVEQGQAPQAVALNLDFPAPYAAWLPGLVEWAGRGHLDRSGAVAPLEDARAELARLRAAMAEPGGNAWWTKWGNEVLLRLAGAAPANEGGK